MSNATVGQVYETIIKEVLEASKQDFDESGFEEGILEELKQGWQKRLSQLAIANFPWDPKPETVPVNNAPPAPSLPEQVMPAASYTQAQLSPPSDAQHISLSHVPLPPIAQSLHTNHIKPEPVAGEPVIKQEPGMHNSSMPGSHPVFAPSLPGGQAGGGVAQARAIQHMQATFGPRASGSINAINQGQIGHPGSAQGQGSQGQRPSGAQAAQQQQLYRAQLAAQMQQQQQSQQQQRAQHPTGVHAPNGVGNSQVDGADESFEGVLMQRSADGNRVELGRVEIDSMLHEQIAARAKRMEGGGLMLPLKHATKHRSVAVKHSYAGISQGDAADDEIKEEIADDDAINSDLDDPDDDQDEDEEDDETNPLMLCMYDKVQRVKNKWKCTLKDGVLTVNGKDYVFHKATGEYEW